MLIIYMYLPVLYFNRELNFQNLFLLGRVDAGVNNLMVIVIPTIQTGGRCHNVFMGMVLKL